MNIAIVGATGLVGERLVALLCDKFVNDKVRLFGNSSVGNKMKLRNKFVTVESCEKLASANIDYAMFMTPNDVSAQYIPPLVKRGVTCIDNSSHFRLKRDVPLVVPCINGELAKDRKLIANPNCSTIQTVIALNPLKELGLTKVTAVTYQAASGAGKDGLTDLLEERCYGKLRSFRHPLCDNVIPCIGEVLSDGSTVEEQKMMLESRKILNLPRLKVNSFCARVPVSTGHCVFVNAVFKERVDVDRVKCLLQNAPNVLLLDDAKSGLYPMPIMLRNTKYVGVGRITKDPTANAVNMFVVADNLLRGAAYNALEILECIRFRPNAL